jgi:hypothetical protein
MVTWGDTSAVEWSAGYSSGLPVTRTHSYADSGTYRVRVRARDTDLAESGWSDSVVVSIGFLPPNQPQIPAGPTSCSTGVACTFTTNATHPLGDSLWFQFDWGVAVGSWDGPVASDSQFLEQHVFDSGGTFNITARAKDARGDTSAWSEPLLVSVTQVAPPARPDVSYAVIQAGAVIRLAWAAVNGAQFYEIVTDDSTYTTPDTIFDVTTPSATIKIRSVSGNGRSEPAKVETGIVETETLRIYGYSDPDTAHYSAFGFDTAGTVTVLRIEPLNFPMIDFYADDVAYPGSMYLVNPGDKSWNAKGNALMYAGTTVFDDVLFAASAGYATQLAIEAGNVYCVWLDPTNENWSLDDHYAKAKVISIVGKEIKLQIGYQKIGGLRWLTR